MSFEKWLIKYKNKDTPIGDLARDFIDSKSNSIGESFEQYSPCTEAFSTYKEARKVYLLGLANDLHNELARLVNNEKLNALSERIIEEIKFPI